LSSVSEVALIALLLGCVLEYERILNQTIARHHAGNDFLHLRRQHLSALHFHAAEGILPDGE
jgi:hypothetical protein